MKKKKLKSALLLLTSNDHHKDLIKILENNGLGLKTPQSSIPSLLPLTYMKGKNKLLLYDNWNIKKLIAQLKGVNPSELEKPMGSIFQNVDYISLREEYNPLEIYQLIKSKYYFS